MRRTPNLSSVSAALAIAAVLAFSGQAQADQVTETFTGMSPTDRSLMGLTGTSKQDVIAQVPIPAAAWLFGSALVGAVALGRRRKEEERKA